MKMKQLMIAAGLVCLATGLTGWAGVTTNSAAQSGDLLRNAYLAVVDAELACSEHHDIEASAAYRKALEWYGRIQAEYPGWQTAMVNYRVVECQNALAALESKTAPEPDPGEATNTEARLETLIDELKEVRLVLAAQPEPPSKAALKQMAKERDDLRDQLDDQVKDNKAMQRTLAKLEAKLKKAGIKESTNTLSSAVSSLVRTEARRLLDGNKTVEAIMLLQEASDLIPADQGIRLTLGMAQCRIGKFADCLATLRPFDVKAPSQADAMLIIGTAYMGLGEIGEARIAMEKALKINPHSAEAHYNLAQILLSLLPADVEGAQEHYMIALQRGLKPDPDFENTLRMHLVISKVRKHNAKSRGVKVEKTPTPAIPVPAH